MIDLHIIGNEKVTRGTIDSYRKLFNASDNPFIVFGGAYNYPVDEFQNVTVYKETFSNSFKLIKLMKYSDRVHIHGLFSLWLCVILAFLPSICDKSVWYIWGDDMYCLLRPKRTFINKLHLWIRRKVYSNIRFVSTNVKGDRKVLEKIMNKHYEFFEMGFGSGLYKCIEPYMNLSNTHHGVNILVGNSATPTNFHIEVFERLKQFKNQDIHIFVPLSYGNKAYAAKVTEAGIQMFGDKFNPLLSFMPAEEYYQLLVNMDIAIFANDRQQAVGNIVPLLFAGKKVYMRDDISTWDCFHDEYGISLANYNHLRTEEFESFSHNGFDREQQKELVKQMCDDKKSIEFLRRALISECNS